MKVLSIAFLSLLVFFSCKSDEAKEADKPVVIDATPQPEQMDSTQFTTVHWLDSLVDFGSVKNGETVDVNFRFRNTGDKPLVIQSVTPACGCTVPEYSKEPVMPGKEGFVKAVFNSTGQAPTVHKTVNVVMNTKNQQLYTLIFMGEVTK